MVQEDTKCWLHNLKLDVGCQLSYLQPTIYSAKSFGIQWNCFFGLILRLLSHPSAQHMQGIFFTFCGLWPTICLCCDRRSARLSDTNMAALKRSDVTWYPWIAVLHCQELNKAVTCFRCVGCTKRDGQWLWGGIKNWLKYSGDRSGGRKRRVGRKAQPSWSFSF